ncbi:MAG: histidine kinase, partial [Rhodospirillales bacterium]|nr:histidine kinase [Rhodospirillales bacterium]
ENRADMAAGQPTENLEELYENAPCGYFSIQTDGRIFKVNATFATWVGFSQEQLIGKRLHDLLNVAGRIFYETHFAPLLRMQGFFNEVALDFVTRQGERLPVFVNAAERRDAEGRHLFTRLTVFNATDRRRYERELVEARAAAELAQKKLQELNAAVQASLLDERATSALREQFIAVLGHDLRNPLAAISAGMELLVLRTPNQKTLSIINTIQRSVARMTGLIDNVMDFARGRLGGGLSLDRTNDGSLEMVLRHVVAELQTAMPDRRIEAYFALTSAVDCDCRRVGQLASNLIGNALTHGAPDEPVRLSANTQGGFFELSVANSGDPIPAKVLESIFQPFTRREHRPGLEGLGLGLYISHEIAKAHGGTLVVASTRAETRFTFRMPLIG